MNILNFDEKSGLKRAGTSGSAMKTAGYASKDYYQEDEVETLREENRELQDQLAELKRQFSLVEENCWDFAERYFEAERKNEKIVNMAAAGSVLHASLNYQEVVISIKSILLNLIGSEEFYLYLLDEGSNRLSLVDHEGPLVVRSSVALGEDPLSRAVKTGNIYVADPARDAGEGYDPLVCVPLKINDKVIGALVIRSFIEGGWMSDDELGVLELLAANIATAIDGSRRYDLMSRKFKALEGFFAQI